MKGEPMASSVTSVRPSSTLIGLLHCCSHLWINLRVQRANMGTNVRIFLY